MTMYHLSNMTGCLASAGATFPRRPQLIPFGSSSSSGGNGLWGLWGGEGPDSGGGGGGASEQLLLPGLMVLIAVVALAQMQSLKGVG